MLRNTVFRTVPPPLVANFVGYVDYDEPGGLVADHNLELVTAAKIFIRLNASQVGTGSLKFTCGAYRRKKVPNCECGVSRWCCSGCQNLGADDVYDGASVDRCGLAVTPATIDVTDSTLTRVTLEG